MNFNFFKHKNNIKEKLNAQDRIRRMRNNSHNIKLWLLLASIPLCLVIAIYMYGNNNFDNSIIKENDVELENEREQEPGQIEERKIDILERMNQSTVLPETHTEPVNTTTKQDKRMLDANGDMITVSVEEDDNLQSIAKEHLGDEAFWVYILDVNKDKLYNLSDVKNGMKLYLPNPEYFGFSPNDQASIAYANQRANEIYAKQNK